MKKSMFASLGVAALVVMGARAAAAQSLQAIPPEARMSEDAARDEARKLELASTILAARESGSRRPFSAKLRASLTQKLQSASVASLEAFASAGGLGNIDELAPNGFGDSAANLIFTPVTPCRIINTVATSTPIAGGSQRPFYVNGNAAGVFEAQGGNAGGCGIPDDATAVAMNFIAVAPTGAGDLRAFPWSATPIAPLASVINYANLPGLNIANGALLPVCNAATTLCTFDLIVQADVSQSHLIVDVVGYLRKVDEAIATNTISATGVVAGDNYYFGPAGTIYTPPQNQRCHVDVAFDLASGGAAFTTGQGYVRVAVRNETAGTNTNIPYGHYVSLGGTLLSAASNNTVSLTAGTAYKFGCWLTASGDFVGATNFIYCNASYICQ